MALRKFLKNWPYKLLALGTAIILTTYVHDQLNPRISTSVTTDLRSRNLQEGFEVILARDRVTVTLQGPKSEVEAVKPEEVAAWVDLSGLEVGNHSVLVRISIPQAALDRGVRERHTPQRVAVSVEARSSRTMTVNVKVKNPPPIGYASSAPTITPNTATVSGRTSLVKSVARLVVEVDPTLLRPSIDEYVPIKALNVRGNEVDGVNVAPDDAHVVLKLVEAPASKSIFVSPTVVGQPQFPYRVAKVSVTPNSVAVKGRPERLAGASVISTEELDVSGATGDLVRYVGLHVPPGLEVDGIRTVKVTVRIVQETGD